MVYIFLDASAGTYAGRARFDFVLTFAGGSSFVIARRGAGVAAQLSSTVLISVDAISSMTQIRVRSSAPMRRVR